MPTSINKNKKIQRYIKKNSYKFFFGDKRCKFNDLSRVKPQKWRSKVSSPIIQFYSSVDNIGNFLPVLGIQKMLNHKTDTWCIHDRRIDFEFINSNYQFVIIGGAGLLHECFESFWQKVLNECKLPIVIWGVGVCLPDSSNVRTDLSDSVKNSGVNRKIIAEIAKRCELINLRDDLTADYYNLPNVDISICPTIVYVEKFTRSKPENLRFLLSSHEELVSLEDQAKILKTVNSSVSDFRYTDNFQKTFQSLDNIITDYYCPSSIVITTRLHGAIIAYSLGIPYIAIARDRKLREFYRMYGNGICLDKIEDITNAIKRILNHNLSMQAIAIEPVLNFGHISTACISSFCSLQPEMVAI